MKRVEPTELVNNSKKLLMLLGEELKQPLVAITQLAEMQNTDNNQINVYARSALRTIDNLLLFQRVSSGQTSLKLEPVHIGSTIFEVAKSMEDPMNTLGFKTEIIIQKGLRPVDSDRRLLLSALQSLWQAFIVVHDKPSEIICQAKNTKKGIRLSIKSQGSGIAKLHLSDINVESVQPISDLAGTSTDLLTSKNIFSLLGSDLTKISTKQYAGFGVTLPISKQLQMV